jgi:hypothetical protein
LGSTLVEFFDFLDGLFGVHVEVVDDVLVVVLLCFFEGVVFFASEFGALVAIDHGLDGGLVEVHNVEEDPVLGHGFGVDIHLAEGTFLYLLDSESLHTLCAGVMLVIAQHDRTTRNRIVVHAANLTKNVLVTLLVGRLVLGTPPHVAHIVA